MQQNNEDSFDEVPIPDEHNHEKSFASSADSTGSIKTQRDILIINIFTRLIKRTPFVKQEKSRVKRPVGILKNGNNSSYKCSTESSPTCNQSSTKSQNSLESPLRFVDSIREKKKKIRNSLNLDDQEYTKSMIADHLLTLG